MNFKFTSDGKKVVVIGALNAQETIVQEVYTKDGTDFPAGEHFVTKTLLDVPAETYKNKKEAELTASIARLKAEMETLQFKVSTFRRCAVEAFDAKLKWIKGIHPAEAEEVMDNVKSMLCGEYTHILWSEYGEVKITEWGDNSFVSKNDNGSFDGIQMISLFGDWRERLTMGWRSNSCRDGSGSWQKFTPCRSFEQAVAMANITINAKENFSDKDINFLRQYNLPIDSVKHQALTAKKRENIEKYIKDYEDKIEGYKKDLGAL